MTMSNRWVATWILTSWGVLLPAWRTAASTSPPEVAGVIALAGDGPTHCLAVELPIPPGQALGGIRWHNNDAQSPFPKVLLVGADEDGWPALSAIGLEVTHPVGASDAWSEITLETPLRSMAGALYAVFTYPSAPANFARGEGGGAGIGYAEAPRLYRTLISDNGARWAALPKSCHILVEPVLVQATTFRLVSQKDGAPAVEEEPTPVAPDQAASWVTRLLPPKPNPSNPVTELSFELAEPGLVRMAVYNLRGQLVATLLNEQLSAGSHSVVWRGVDARGSQVASGVYSIQMEVAGKTYRQRLALLR